MAEKKTTTKKASPKEKTLIEENAGKPEVSSEEILAETKPNDEGQPEACIKVVDEGEIELKEDKPLDVVQAEDRTEPAGELAETVQDEPIEVKPATGEEENEPGDVPQVEEPEKELEDVEKELDDFNKELEKKIEEVQSAEPEKIAEVAKVKLSELEEMERELAKDIEKEEAGLSEGQKKAANRLFGRGFGDFWNGVSSGWEN